MNAPRPRLFPAIFSVGPSAAAPLRSFLSLPTLPATRPHRCSQSQLRARFTYLDQQSRSPHDIYVLHLAAQKEKIHPGEDIVQKKYGRKRGAVVNRKKNSPEEGARRTISSFFCPPPRWSKKEKRKRKKEWSTIERPPPQPSQKSHRRLESRQDYNHRRRCMVARAGFVLVF